MANPLFAVGQRVKFIPADIEVIIMRKYNLIGFNQEDVYNYLVETDDGNAGIVSESDLEELE